MRIKKYKTIYQLVFMPHIFPINCYLVEEDNCFTLIDTGLSYCGRQIIKAAEKLGKPITKIVLTHPHGDHIGGLTFLKAHLPDVRIYISERDSHILSGNLKTYPGERPLPVKGGVPKNFKQKPDVLLAENDQVDSLTAFYAPGHTPGSMVFLDRRSHILITGDTWQTRGGLAVAGDINLSFPFPAFGTWDFEGAIKSARKLLGLNADALATGHGAILTNPAIPMKKAIAQAEKKFMKGRKDHGKR